MTSTLRPARSDSRSLAHAGLGPRRRSSGVPDAERASHHHQGPLRIAAIREAHGPARQASVHHCYGPLRVSPTSTNQGCQRPVYSTRPAETSNIGERYRPRAHLVSGLFFDATGSATASPTGGTAPRSDIQLSLGSALPRLLPPLTSPPLCRPFRRPAQPRSPEPNCGYQYANLEHVVDAGFQAIEHYPGRSRPRIRNEGAPQREHEHDASARGARDMACGSKCGDLMLATLHSLLAILCLAAQSHRTSASRHDSQRRLAASRKSLFRCNDLRMSRSFHSPSPLPNEASETCGR
ncbi:hypothetical protein B0H12DRAFT_1237552 [Mycena haematopus]|nr:hypothetical protein B0H12DRAFT_1237552 [Mycena haematopus]